MEEIYNKTGRFTADGEVFHYSQTNVRIGEKHYGNASEETLKYLGLFENLLVYVQERDYFAALETMDEEDPNFPYHAGWKIVNGEKCWISYEIIPDQIKD